MFSKYPTRRHISSPDNAADSGECILTFSGCVDIGDRVSAIILDGRSVIELPAWSFKYEASKKTTHLESAVRFGIGVKRLNGSLC